MIIYFCVATIDVAVCFFDIDNILVYHGYKQFEVRTGNVEAGFDIDFPLRATAFAELADKLTLQTGFATTESDAATGCQKIETCEFHPFL